MMAAEAAARAWVNAQPALVGPGSPLSNGAFLADQRSPADGSYAVLHRTTTSLGDLVAEDDGVSAVRFNFDIYAGTELAAEAAAVALADRIRSLRGCPEPMGDSGLVVMASAYLTGPDYQPVTEGPFSYRVSADFIMRSA